jgi:uncharacterized SAM-binding protein YcdF (DUF218 family)
VAPVVWFVFSVGGIVVLLLIIALWLRARPQSANARRTLLTLAIFYIVVSLYGVTYGAGRLLVIGFHPLRPSDVPPGRTVIVLLGSGSHTSEDWDRRHFSMLDRPSANHVFEALRLFNAIGAEWIITSGGLLEPDDPDEANGLTMRDELVRLGVPSAKILVEIKSRTTRDEAIIIREMLQQMSFDQVILVTSDIHMRRSLGTFRREGIRAIPAIAPHVYEDVPWFLPSNEGLHEAGAVAHEILGLAYYVIRGWYRW